MTRTVRTSRFNTDSVSKVRKMEPDQKAGLLFDQTVGSPCS